ncbi:MAG: hypothetical protein JRI68_33620, partial [Deltaproteobacteria bacterium]|nr:hypothetical protein [Deltaproteobacteria bacterium]
MSAVLALLCTCQPAWAKPSPEPQPPAQAPETEAPDEGPGDPGKAEDDEGKSPKDGADPGKAEDDKPDGDKPSDGKSPKDPGDDGKAPEPDEGPTEPSKPEPPPPAKPPVVEHTEPKFIGDGEVPKVTVYLAKTLAPVGQCVAAHGGLEKPTGELEIQFLVRARGRAEGVEVLSSNAVSTEAGRCVRKYLKNRWVGTPTNDPVG